MSDVVPSFSDAGWTWVLIEGARVLGWARATFESEELATLEANYIRSAEIVTNSGRLGLG